METKQNPCISARVMELMTGFEPVTSSLSKGRNPLKCKVFNEIYNGTNEGMLSNKFRLEQQSA